VSLLFERNNDDDKDREEEEDVDDDDDENEEAADEDKDAMGVLVGTAGVFGGTRGPHRCVATLSSGIP
jgi:hypothetical protein